MAQLYELVRGTSRDIPLEARVKLNAQPFSILSTDVLACKVWEGDDQTPVATPTVIPNGATPTDLYVIKFVDTDTALLEPGDYGMLATLTRGSQTVPMTAGAILRILPKPGVGVARLTLVTHDQVLSFASSIDAVLRVGQDQSGFREQRADASAEFLRLLLDRYQPRPGFSRVRKSYPHPRQGYDWQSFGIKPPTKAAIQAAINSTGLVMDEVATEIVCRIAIALILGDEVAGDGRGGGYGAIATANRSRATSLMRTYQAYVAFPPNVAPNVIIDHDVTFLTHAETDVGGMVTPVGTLAVAVSSPPSTVMGVSGTVNLTGGIIA